VKRARRCFAKTSSYLDKGYGSCLLKDERVAKLTEDSLLFHHTKKYDLVAWVIMPNHIHFLATPLESIELSAIAHSIKSYTAHEANKLLGRQGQFWQHEPFDRYIRNRKHFVSVIRYIENNPVESGALREAAGLALFKRLSQSEFDWSATVPVASLIRANASETLALQSYFLNRFAKAWRASVGFPDPVSRSTTVRAANNSQLFRADLFTIFAVIGFRHSKRAPGSK
jgi:REP element-mobilizing transposase RayT